MTLKGGIRLRLQFDIEKRQLFVRHVDHGLVLSTFLEQGPSSAVAWCPQCGQRVRYLFTTDGRSWWCRKCPDPSLHYARLDTSNTVVDRTVPAHVRQAVRKQDWTTVAQVLADGTPKQQAGTLVALEQAEVVDRWHTLPSLWDRRAERGEYGRDSRRKRAKRK